MSRPTEEIESPRIREARVITMMILGVVVASIGAFAEFMEVKTPPVHIPHAATSGAFILLGAFFIWPKSLELLLRLVGPFLPRRAASISSLDVTPPTLDVTPTAPPEEPPK